jgi:stage II sporulation protein D
MRYGVRRRSFLGASGALLACGPRIARATGGRDIADPASTHQIRVMLSGDAGSAPVPQPVDAFTFSWSGINYRGTFATVPLAGGRLALVNTLPVDAYLYGVVSKEVSAGWPAAAIDAQAILARSYALAKLRPDKPYDVSATSSDQVYGGISSESVEVRASVDATAGTVVTYRGALATIAYSSCCGGHTASAADVWGGALAYLTGVQDPYCRIAPDYRWQREIPYATASRALESVLAGLGDLTSIELRDVDPSGRPRNVALIGELGETTMKTSAFRLALDPNVVRSTFLRSVRVLRDDSAPATLAIEGSGRGHGVGLCQWGARGLAQTGASAAQIVAFYFSATALGRL